MRRILLRAAAWVLAGAGALAASARAAGADGAVGRADIERALERGVAFLLSQQRPDGGWISSEYGTDSAGHTTAITAAAMEAVLAGSGGSADAVESVRRAFSFLDGQAGRLREGKEHHGFDFNGWGAAYGLRHLAGVRDRWPASAKGGPPDASGLVKRFTTWAEENRHPCGGWSYLTKEQDPRFATDGSVSFLTGVMIEGLARWDPKSPLIAPAADDLEKATDDEGRVLYSHAGDWPGYPRGREESAGRSLQTAFVLAELGRRSDDDVEARLAEFLAVRGEYVKVRNSHPHADPHKIAGYYYHHAHSYAARALRRLAARERTPSPARAARVQVLLAALVAEQDADGAWLDAPCGDRPYATSLAVLELTDLRELLFPWAANLDDAVAAARERSAPVVVLFTDGGKASAKAEEALQDAELQPVRDACLWVRVPRAGAEEVWKAARVSSPGSVLVLAAAGDWSTEAPASRFGASVSAKLLLRAIRKVLPAEGGK